MMDPKKKAMLMVLICTFFTSIAQVFYKAGVQRTVPFTFMGVITNWQIWSGLVLYGIGALILIRALQGADLSLLYPIIATSYIWVMLFSFILFKESVNVFKILGVVLIIVGVAAMGYGSKAGVAA